MTPAPPATPVTDIRPIYASASKIVFVMIALTVCVGFFMKLLTQDNLMYIATSVFSYYFGKSQGNKPPDPPKA